MTAATFEQHHGSAVDTIRVLLIDDAPSATQVLSTLLQRWGFQTEVVNDSREALHAIRQFCPDVILLDINMPIFNGYQVARAARADHAINSIPIIAVTSLDDDEHLRRSLEVGIRYQITKPWDIEELNALIDELTTPREPRVE